MKNDTHIVYKLARNGKTAQAAWALRAVLDRELADNPIAWEGRNLAVIGDDFRSMYRRLHARLAEENPELLQMTGLLPPAIQVTVYNCGFPRAYSAYPALYGVSTQKDPDLYLYAPVDYKGGHFVPADASAVAKKDLGKVEDGLFGGGWVDPISFLDMPAAGVPMPAGFDQKIHHFLNGSYREDRGDAVFVAAGRSLEVVEAFRKRESEWRAACDAVWQELKRILEIELSAALGPLAAQLPEGQTFKASGGYSYGGSHGKKTAFEIEARIEGSGEKLTIPANAYFKIENGNVVPNKETPEGKTLRKFFHAVPPVPSLADYPDILGNFTLSQNDIDKAIGIDGVVPRVRDLGGRTLLIYQRDLKDKSAYCPPGAVPMDARIYVWLDQDERDKNRGVLPPPMPDELVKLMGTGGLRSLIKVNAARAEPAGAIFK